MSTEPSRASWARALRRGLGALAVAWCAAGSALAAPEVGPLPEPVSGVAETWEMSFETGLHLRNDRMLQGITTTESFDLPLPRRWRLTADPIVVLRFDHSAVLIPERSTLTIAVNGTTLSTVRLDASNTTGGVVRAQVPRAILDAYNRLTLSVVQHVGPECEDPFDPALWTRVSLASSVIWAYAPRAFEPELLGFPYPFLDPTGYLPLEFALAGPVEVSPSQLAALSWIAPAFGRIASFRQLRLSAPVTDLADASSHLLMVGTPAENPLISGLLGPLTLEAGEGLVAAVANPTDPRYGVLVVTGADADGVLRAAQAIAGEDRHELLSGSRAVVRAVSRPGLPPAQGSSAMAPPDRRFPLSELGFKDTTVRGFYPYAVEIPLELEADAHVRPESAALRLRYAYSALLDSRLSALEIRLNGVSLRSVSLSEPEGSASEEVVVQLPFELVRPNNTVELVFHLFPTDFNPCEFTTDRHIWATVFADSEFELVRDNYALLPNLALLRHDLWPLARAAGAEGLVVGLPSRTTAWTATAAAQLAAQIAVSTRSPTLTLDMQPATASLLSRYPDRHAVLLVDGELNDAWAELARTSAVTSMGDLKRLLRSAGLDLLKADVGTPYATIEQTLHPNNPDRTVLILRGGDDRGLMTAARALSNETTLYRLDGNIAVTLPEGAVSTLAVAEQRQIGHPSAFSGIQAALRAYWLPLGGAAVLGVLVINLLVRVWAGRRGGQTA